MGEKDTEKFTVAGKMEREHKLRPGLEEKPARSSPSPSTVSTPVRPVAEKFVEEVVEVEEPDQRRYSVWTF